MSAKKQQAFLQLYDPIHERFERFCRARAYGCMDPDDLLHESLLIAYEQFNRLRSEEAFLSFLFGISIRLLANANRKKRPELSGDDQYTQRMVSQEQDGELAADVRLLYEALSKLPDAQQEALALFELSGFSIREIAAMQSVTEGAVKQRLVRGRKQLALLLKQPVKIGQGGKS